MATTELSPTEKRELEAVAEQFNEGKISEIELYAEVPDTPTHYRYIAKFLKTLSYLRKG